MNVVEEKWNEIIEHLRVEHELSHISFSYLCWQRTSS